MLTSEGEVGRVEARADESGTEVGDRLCALDDSSERGICSTWFSGEVGVGSGHLCVVVTLSRLAFRDAGILATADSAFGASSVGLSPISTPESDFVLSVGGRVVSGSACAAGVLFDTGAVDSGLVVTDGKAGTAGIEDCLALSFSFRLYICWYFFNRDFSGVIPEDFGSVAGSDLTLPALERGLGISKVAGVSGIGGGGGKPELARVESPDFRRGCTVDAGRDVRIPAGSVATARALFEEPGRLSADGLGPSFAFDL